uniref:Uncharacterized protein n=1 Tax=Plectus sambesii TaxID=2011161 RepID=A0A914UVJ0_9BILA
MQSTMRAAVVRLRLLHRAVGRCPQRPCSSTVDNRVTGAQQPSSPVDLLRQIVANLANAGHKMVLPESSEALEQLARPLSDLLASGAPVLFVQKTFSSNPALLKLTAKHTTQWTALMTMLMSSCALKADEALGMMNAYSDVLLQIGAEEIGRRTEAILSNGLSSSNMRSLILSCPEVLLTRDASSIVHLCESLRGFFSNSLMKQLLVSHPQVLLSNLEELQLKYEYVFFHMGIESTELLKCKEWITLTLDEIMERHQFLVRTGVYIYPDPKKPQLEQVECV